MDDRQIAIDHLKNHIKKWPAMAEELKAACNNMEDVPETMRKEFLDKLPDGTYNSAEEVMTAVGWSE